MKPEPERLLTKYRRKGVFVDTNLLLLLFIGTMDRAFVPKFKRLTKYRSEDFDVLARYLGLFEHRLTTPNILTEVSNLTKKALTGDYEGEFPKVFGKWIEILEEHYVVSRDLLGTQEFFRLGLADAGIMSLVKGNYLLLTDDLSLSCAFASIGGDVLNFNHLRPPGWQTQANS